MDDLHDSSANESSDQAASGSSKSYRSKGIWLTRAALALMIVAMVAAFIAGKGAYDATCRRIEADIRSDVTGLVRILALTAEHTSHYRDTVDAAILSSRWLEIVHDKPDQYSFWAADRSGTVLIHTADESAVGQPLLALNLTPPHDNRDILTAELPLQDLWSGWVTTVNRDKEITAVAFLAPIGMHLGVVASAEQETALVMAALQPWTTILIVLGLGLAPAMLLLHRAAHSSALRSLREAEQAREYIARQSRRGLDQMALFFDKSPVGFVLFDSDFRYLRINEALAKPHGISPSDHIGRTLREIAPTVVDAVEPIIRQVIETKKPTPPTTISASAPNQPLVPRDWIVSYYPTLDDDGNVDCVGGVVQDVTDSNRSFRQLELIADATGAVLYSHTVDPTVVTYMSPSVERLWGIPCDQMIEDPNRWWESVHEADRAACREQKEEWMRSPQRQHLEQEYRVVLPDGGVGWVRDSRFAVLDGAGRIKEVLGVAIDVTDNRRSREALRLIAEGTTSTGPDFFNSLVVSLAQTLGARWVLIGQMIDGMRVRSIAYAVDGRLSEGVEYDLESTPCAAVAHDRESCFFNQNVAGKFPNDCMLLEMGVESYLGTPLQTLDGETIGILVVMDDEPIDEALNPESILQVFASRAASELERQLTLRQLVESESLLREAQRVARLGNFDWDIVTGQMVWSDGVYELLDVPRNGVAPSLELLFSNVPEEHRDTLRQQFRNALEHENEYSFDQPILTRDGALRHVHSQGRIYRDRSGIAVRVVGTAIDISDRKSAERTLQRSYELLEERVAERTQELVGANESVLQSERRLRAMFENSGVGVVLMDTDLRVTQANPAVLEMLSMRLDDLLGEELPLLVHADDRDAAVMEARDVLSCKSESAQHEVRLRRSDAEYVWSRVTCSLMPERPGETSGLVAFVENITERKLAEDAARERQDELAHVSRFIAVGELAAGLAHELNQPLAAVSAYADTCARRLRNNGADTETLATIHKIGEQSRRAGDIVHRLKNLVRKRAPQREPFDLARVLAESADILTVEARNRGLRVALDVSVGDGPTEADPVQVQQVAINLIKNAIEATPAQLPEGLPANAREVLVRARRDSQNGILVGVRNWSDNSKDELPEEIFDLFYSTRPQGMGLGLSISRSIVSAHGGRLWTHKEDDGTWFSFSLPDLIGAQHDAVGISDLHS